MKFAVVDLQAFQFQDGSVMAKELCIFDGKETLNLLLLPTVKYENLSQVDKRTANWLTNNHHGLQFDGGFIRAEDVPEVLSVFLKDIDRIYVKGEIKYNYLINNLRGRQYVINLENNENVPKLLPNMPCKFHLNLNKNVMCALNNVRVLYNYLALRLPL